MADPYAVDAHLIQFLIRLLAAHTLLAGVAAWVLDGRISTRSGFPLVILLFSFIVGADLLLIAPAAPWGDWVLDNVVTAVAVWAAYAVFRDTRETLGELAGIAVSRAVSVAGGLSSSIREILWKG